MLEFFEKPGVVIVLLVALIVFGSKRLPDSARSLGRSMRILKAEAKGLKDDDTTPSAPPVPPAALPPVSPPLSAPVDTVPAPAYQQPEQRQPEQRQP